MTSHVLLSSDRTDWRTPPWFLDLVRSVAPIAFDPATSMDNPTGAELFYARQNGGEPLTTAWLGSCGLRWSWPSGLTFVNPPYGPHLSGSVDPDAEIVRGGKVIGIGTGWAEKIAHYMDRGHECIALVPVRTETAWWRRLFGASSATCLWSSPTRGCRISFINPDTGKPAKGSNLASTVFYSGPRVECFEDVFRAHGTLVHRARRVPLAKANAA